MYLGYGRRSPGGAGSLHTCTGQQLAAVQRAVCKPGGRRVLRRSRQRTIKSERELRNRVPPASKLAKNSCATETPVTDGQAVSVYHGKAGLFAVGFWRTLLSEDGDTFVIQ